MAVIVRSLRQDEVYTAAEIGQIAFGTEAIDPWIGSYTWISQNPGLDHLIVAEADGELVGSLVCTPGLARFGEDIIPLCAVGGVATLPEHRRNGYAGLMMQEAVRLLYRKGYHTSALWPFSYAYYRKFGWEVGCEHRRYTVPSELASQLTSSEGVRPVTREDLPDIANLIDSYALCHNSITLRDQTWWDCLAAINSLKYDGCDDPGKCLGFLLHESDGVVDGFACYRFEGEGEQARVEIRELVSANSRARSALLKQLSQEGLPNLIFYAPIDDDFLQSLPDPRSVRTELQPGFQFRVVNPKAALTARTVDPSLGFTISFSITDPVQSPFYFTAEVTGGAIITTQEVSSNSLTMDIRTFSQLYSGFISPSRATELGLIEPSSAKAVNLADKLFKSRVPFRSMLELG
jgi:predicted acetyltransferase